ncbi:MAG: hypothetical protein Q4D93_03385 [Porphyromonas sp.]|nr:hypothetical protein [Porphyromonas sp.]
MRKNNYPTSLLVVALILLSSALEPVKAQETSSEGGRERLLERWIMVEPWEFDGELPTTHTKHLLGYSWHGILDEYLSPISHNGWSVGYRILQDLPQKDGRSYHFYQELQLMGGIQKNPANSFTIYTIGGSHSIGPSWRVIRANNFTLDLGPLLSLDVQGNTKLSNSNNIGNFKASLGADAWSRAIYTIPTKYYPISISYSAQLPLMRLAFFPDFGQSYYEYVSGENRSNPKLHFMSWHNSFILRQRLLVEMPIRNITLNAGVEHSYQTETASAIHFRQGYFMLVLGISLDHFILTGGKSRSSQLTNSYYE